MNKNEIWKPVKGYEGVYSVSSFGRVRREEFSQILPNGAVGTIKSHIMKSIIGSNNYLYVVLCQNNKRKRYSVHRLVAIAFLPNPNNLPEVNHKDQNRQNAMVDNLEWCDRLYNVRYGDGIEKAAKKKSKPIDRYTLNGEYIDTWESQQEFYRKHNITGDSLIYKACAGTHNIISAYGYKWRFHDDKTPFRDKKQQGNKICQYSMDGILLNTYSSVLAASRATGIDRSTISRCASGKYKHSGGYVWKYFKDVKISY